MSKRKKEKVTAEDLARIKVGKALESYSPLEWAFRLCQDQAYYDVNGIQIATLIQITPIRDLPIEVIKFSDLRSIASLSERIKEVVDDLEAKKTKDDSYVLAEDFIGDMTPFRMGRRYWMGDSSYVSKCYVDEETGDPTEIIPNEFWVAFKATVPEEKRKEMEEDSIDDVTIRTSEGVLSVSSLGDAHPQSSEDAESKMEE